MHLSSLARWSYTQVITIWPVTYDQYSQPSYGTPYTVTGSWIAGGERQTDSNGNEFTPNSTYYFEAEDGSSDVPEVDWFIQRGTQTGDPGPDAERIKKVTGYDVGMFGANEIPDWMVAT